jgi:hypothetical protein
MGVGRRPVPPKIVALAVCGDLVCGRIEFSPYADPPSPNAPPLDARGYFILDTKGGTVVLRLGKQEWLEKLSDRGVTREPHLRKPSASFRY